MTHVYEIPGRFWIPLKRRDDSEAVSEVPADKQIPGVMRVKEHAVELQLFGSLSRRYSLREPARYALVHGWLHRSPPSPHLSGAAVTLVRSVVSQLAWSLPGSQIETLTVNRAFVGDTHIDAARIRVKAAVATIAGLARLISRRPFEVTYAPKISLTADATPIATMAVLDDGAKVSIETTVKEKSGADEFIVRSDTRFVVTPGLPVGLAEIARDYLEPMRNLVTLATNRHAPIGALSFYIVQGDDSVPIHEVRADRGPLETKDEGGFNILFDLPAEGEDFTRLVKRWLELSSQHRKLFGWIFGLFEAPPVFTEISFQEAFAAFEMLSKRLFNTEPAETIQRSAYVASLASDPGALWMRLQEARDSVWDERKPTSESLGLFFLCQAILWLLKTSLFDALGLDPEQVKNTFEFRRNAEWVRKRLSEPIAWAE